MKIKKKHIFRFFGPFFSSFIIFWWDFVENEKNHQKSTVILLHFWLSKQKNYFWSHAKLAKMSSFQCTVPPLPPLSTGLIQALAIIVFSLHEFPYIACSVLLWNVEILIRAKASQANGTPVKVTHDFNCLAQVFVWVWKFVSQKEV